MIVRFVLFISLMSSFMYAGVYKVGDSIIPFSLPDQFDKVHLVNSKEYKVLFVAFEKDVAVRFSKHLQDKPMDFLQKHKALFISDIHEMPSFVTKMFALPKMRDYPYPLLLIYEQREIFPKQADALTIVKMGKNAIEQIDFVREDVKIESILQTLDF